MAPPNTCFNLWGNQPYVNIILSTLSSFLGELNFYLKSTHFLHRTMRDQESCTDLPDFTSPFQPSSCLSDQLVSVRGPQTLMAGPSPPQTLVAVTVSNTLTCRLILWHSAPLNARADPAWRPWWLNCISQLSFQIFMDMQVHLRAGTRSAGIMFSDMYYARLHLIILCTALASNHTSWANTEFHSYLGWFLMAKVIWLSRMMLVVINIESDQRFIMSYTI